jgi:hypothetical protein
MPKKPPKKGPPKKGGPAKSKKAPPKKAKPKGPPSGKALSPEQAMLARGFRPTGRRDRVPMREGMHPGHGDAEIDEG